MTRSRFFIIALSFMLLAQACSPATQETMDDEQQTMENSMVTEPPVVTTTATPLPTETFAPTAEPSATLVVLPSVRILAASGNLYIRRGPGTAYNTIGVLYKGASAEVIGQDVLSKWVQVNIPDSDTTGWVSLLTPFSQIEGDLSQVAAFTFTDWPEPAYIKNCTEHDMFVDPVNLYLYNLWTNSSSRNEVQVDPGTYEIRDLFVADHPLVETVQVREGETAYITVNGLGVHHFCP